MSETKEPEFLVTYPVRAFLDVSTACLRESTHNVLNGWTESDPSVRAVECAKTSFGWFVHAPEELTEYHLENIPDDLVHVLRFARRRKCEYVLFDRDATSDKMPELPNYEEDPLAETPSTLPEKWWDVTLLCNVTDGMRGTIKVRARTAEHAGRIALSDPSNASWKSIADGGYEDVEIDEITADETEPA